MDLPIGVYFQKVGDAIQFEQDGKTPFTPAQIMHIAYHAINKTGLYSLALKEWRKKAMADKTWDIFKQVFTEEYHDLVEETNVTNLYPVFRSANVMQDIGGCLSTSPWRW